MGKAIHKTARERPHPTRIPKRKASSRHDPHAGDLIAISLHGKVFRLPPVPLGRRPWHVQAERGFRHFEGSDLPYRILWDTILS